MATDETADLQGQEDSTRKTSKRPIFLALALCLIGLGIGYFSVSNGLLPIGSMQPAPNLSKESSPERPDVAFIPIPTLIVSLPAGAEHDHLRFSGQIEVPSEFKEDVEFLMPRIQDFMNGYLRALSAEDIEGEGALFRIRLHLFRRIIMVIGLGKANGLLITEFILK
ncbi:flagellar basal body-associated protein FliL [Marivita sp. S0852]|uniref:flagellar basal body-associated FliL family protein n=1 Tax=Marivita sp. S0852 TaxID=3373893 RepID=UPI003982987E